MKIKFLGTAANGGVPQVDCRCVNCKSNINVRMRSSILVEINNRKMVVDCGPDFHTQLIGNNLRLKDIAGIVISHLHWDHSAGLFELASGKAFRIPVFVHPKLREAIQANNMFNFIFEKGWAKFSSIKGFDVKLIEITHDPNFPTFAIGISGQGKQILIATDISKISRSFLEIAKNSDLIIFDSTFLNQSRHWHISIKESAPVLAKINRNVIFTHTNHSENPRLIQKYLNRFKFKLAFDGMEVKI